MKGVGILVACIASWLAMSPFWAYLLRPRHVAFEGALEDWFVSALRGGTGVYMLYWTTVTCVAIGAVLGCWLRRALLTADAKSPAKPDMRARVARTLLRMPLVSAVLVPCGVAMIVLFVYNPMPRLLDGIVWPKVYREYWWAVSACIALAAAVLAGLLNERERKYKGSLFFDKVTTLCCLPLAVVIDLMTTAGLVGAGVLCGMVLGELCRCPIAAAWTGAFAAIAILALDGGIFWPLYFPESKEEEKKK